MAQTENEGIIDPSVDELLDKAESKYGLVIFGARRARQINAYYSQLQEGLFEHVGPLVDTDVNEKSLSIAMREIEDQVIESHHVDGGTFNENGQLVHDEQVGDFFDADFFASGTEISGDAFVDFSESAQPTAEGAVEAVEATEETTEEK